MSFPTQSSVKTTSCSTRWSVLAGLALLLTACAPGEAPPDSTSQVDTAPVVSSFLGEDGARIEYEVRGAGPTTLVFVHGWSCDRGYWRAQVEHFADRYKVVAVDLAGHGASETGGRTDWSMAAFAADVAGVIEQEALERVVLVGHSMGGPVVVEAAAMVPERVLGVVTVEALQDVSMTLSPEQVGGFLAPFQQDFETSVDQFVRGAMFPPGTDPNLVDEVAGDMAEAPSTVGLPAFEAFLQWDAGEALSRLEQPLHLINTDLVPVNHEALEMDYSGASVGYVEDASHFIMMTHPEQFNRHLQQVLDGLERDPAS